MAATKTTGARGIATLAANPACSLLAAMVAEGVDERQFYEDITGRPFPREYGVRASECRRGVRFERRLYRNDAELLKLCLAAALGIQPDSLTMRDLSLELPGDSSTIRARRLLTTRRILADWRDGRPTPDIVVQPQLVLPLSSRPSFVSPDFIVMVPSLGRYLSGEVKSAIVTPGRPNELQLRRARTQMAVETVALRREYARAGILVPVDNRAYLVHGTGFGVEASYAVEEQLDAEVYAVETAIRAIGTIPRQLQLLRQGQGNAGPLSALAPNLPFNYEDACKTTCVLWSWCRDRYTGQAREIGDEAARLLGIDTPLTRAIELMRGATPANDVEAVIARRLQDALRVLGYTQADIRVRRTTA